MNWIKNFIVVFVVTGLSFEVLSFIATKFKLFLINETPTIYRSLAKNNHLDIVFGRTEREKWGSWHVSGSSFIHSANCFDVTMTFNEVGARDESFSNLPTSSLFLLGDSFAEGVGVDREEMSEYIIEQELKVPVLNFGVAGVGPLSELLIYKHFKYLPHQGLIVYVFPLNDFTDHDLDFWKNRDQTRYRPYFSSNQNPLKPYYFPTAIPRDNFLFTKSDKFRQFIKNIFWSANALRTALMLIRGDAKFVYVESIKNSLPSYYYDATKKQQLNLVAAYEAILNQAGNKDVLFVVIPSIHDIARWQSEPNRNSYQNSYWYKSFISFKNRTEQRVEILDLMKYLPTKTRELFLKCNGHWSAFGNAWVSEVILGYIRSKNLFLEKN